MSNVQDVFKRYEKKYVLNPQQYRQLLLLISQNMKKDQYGMHTISNVYYDTEDYALIRTSIEKPLYKEKLRVRSYGIPEKNDLVFIEIKKKFKGVVYKRRSQMSLEEAGVFLNVQDGTRRCKVKETTQILQEIEWFKKRYQPVPKVLIAYERTAYYSTGDDEIRITFDQNIRFRENELDLSKGHYGKPLLDSGQILMEIKIPGVMPLWLSQVLAQLEIYPTSFSKYGNCYTHYLINSVYTVGGRKHA